MNYPFNHFVLPCMLARMSFVQHATFKRAQEGVAFDYYYLFFLSGIFSGGCPMVKIIKCIKDKQTSLGVHKQ